MRALVAIILLASLVAIGSGAGLAAGPVGAPTTPVPPPGGPPGGPPLRTGPSLWSQFPGSPTDFHFAHFELYGQGFKPGEQVTLTTEHVTVSPVTVTADQNGGFSTTVDFTWVFCGPGGTIAPPPVFHAGGDMGSTAALAILAQPCPELIATRAPEPYAGSGGSTGTAGSGTAVAVTAVAVSTVVSVPPASSPPLTPAPGPGPTALRATNLVEGFGFQPGEGVTVREENSPAETPAPVSTAANSQGEFGTKITVYVPGPCNFTAPPPRIVATGDRGTSASVRPANPPMPMYPCAVPPPSVVPPGIPDPGVPAPVVPAGPPTITPKSHPTTVPASRPTRKGPQSSLVLSKNVVAPGATDTATIVTPLAETVRLTVRYPGYGSARWTVTTKALKPSRLRWTVPRDAHSGTARVEARFLAESLTRNATFKIR